MPNLGLGAYCVTKYGVVALSECLRKDLRDTGIGVSVLCPMRVETNINENSFRMMRPGEALPEPGASGIQQSGDIKTADEVAQVVVDGVRKNQLYLLPHPESRGFVRNRFQRIDAAYES